jgi:hypothetical protein
MPGSSTESASGSTGSFSVSVMPRPTLTPLASFQRSSSSAVGERRNLEPKALKTHTHHSSNAGTACTLPRTTWPTRRPAARAASVRPSQRSRPAAPAPSPRRHPYRPANPRHARDLVDTAHDLTRRAKRRVESHEQGPPGAQQRARCSIRESRPGGTSHGAVAARCRSVQAGEQPEVRGRLGAVDMLNRQSHRTP